MVSIRVSQEGDSQIDGQEGHRNLGHEGYWTAKKATLLSSVGLCHARKYNHSGGSEADNRPVAQEDSSHYADHRERGPGRSTDQNPPPAQEGDMAASCSFFHPLDSC